MKKCKGYLINAKKGVTHEPTMYGEDYIKKERLKDEQTMSRVKHVTKMKEEVEFGEPLEKQLENIYMFAKSGSYTVADTLNELQDLSEKIMSYFPEKIQEGPHMMENIIPDHIKLFEYKMYNQAEAAFRDGKGLIELKNAKEWALPMYDATYKIGKPDILAQPAKPEKSLRGPKEQTLIQPGETGSKVYPARSIPVQPAQPEQKGERGDLDSSHINGYLIYKNDPRKDKEQTAIANVKTEAEVRERDQKQLTKIELAEEEDE